MTKKNEITQKWFYVIKRDKLNEYLTDEAIIDGYTPVFRSNFKELTDTFLKIGQEITIYPNIGSVTSTNVILTEICDIDIPDVPGILDNKFKVLYVMSKEEYYNEIENLYKDYLYKQFDNISYCDDGDIDYYISKPYEYRYLKEEGASINLKINLKILSFDEFRLSNEYKNYY